MQLKDNKKMWVLIIFIILIFVVIFQISKYMNIERNEYDIMFRQVYGDINVRKDKENVLSLAFIVKNTNSKFDDYLSRQRLINNISFNTEKIKISQFSVVESLNYKNNSYYFLNMKLVTSEEFSDVVQINTISLGEDTYDIGNLTLKLVVNDIGDLKIESAKAFSLGMGITDFSATVKNTSDSEQVKFLNVYNGQMASLNPEVVLKTNNEATFKGHEGIAVAPNETVDFILRFNKQSTPLDFVYYISPIIQYEDVTGTHSLYFDYYSAGLNISKSEFISLITKDKVND